MSHEDFSVKKDIYTSSSDLSRDDQILLAKEKIAKLKELSERFKSMHFLKPPISLSYHGDFNHGIDYSFFNNFLSEVDVKLGKINDTVLQLKSELAEVKNENLEIKHSLVDYVSNSIFKNIAQRQFVEIEIYIDTHNSDSILDVYKYTKLAIESLDLEYDIELPAIWGSWYKRLLARTKTAVTSEEVVSRLKEVEYAFEVKILKDQSEVDKNQSEAVLNILRGIENTPNAVIRIGSLLIIKITDITTNIPSIQVRTLAIKELHFLNKNPHLTGKPTDLLNALSQISKDNDNLLN